MNDGGMGDWRLKDVLLELERGFIEEAFKRSEGNTAHAGRILGVSRTTLVEKCKRMGIAGYRQTKGNKERNYGLN